MRVTILLSHHFRQSIFPFLLKTFSPFFSLTVLRTTAFGNPFLEIRKVPIFVKGKYAFFRIES